VWHWRRRNARVFWISISVFFFLHTLGLLLYSMWAHPLLLAQWIVLMAVESFLLVFGLSWLMRRAGGC
jgi:hypothetical protein